MNPSIHGAHVQCALFDESQKKYKEGLDIIFAVYMTV